MEDPLNLKYISDQQGFLQYIISLLPVDQKAKIAKLILTKKVYKFWEDVIQDID